VQVFKKILCAVDFDNNSLAALDFAARLATQNNASLHPLHVVAVPVAGLGYPSTAYERLRHSAQRNLEEITGRHVPAEVACSAIVRVGDPADAIIATANELDVDLIVMATHARSGIDRIVLGSVAESVLRRTNRPVLALTWQAAAAITSRIQTTIR